MTVPRRIRVSTRRRRACIVSPIRSHKILYEKDFRWRMTCIILPGEYCSAKIPLKVEHFLWFILIYLRCNAASSGQKTFLSYIPCNTQTFIGL